MENVITNPLHFFGFKTLHNILNSIFSPNFKLKTNESSLDQNLTIFQLSYEAIFQVLKILFGSEVTEVLQSVLKVGSFSAFDDIIKKSWQKLKDLHGFKNALKLILLV